ncbi:948_t:CDS:1, partial [Paraglomus brasilianum]
QEGAGEQVDNSTQPDKLQTLDQHALLNNSVQQNAYKQLQSLDEYALLSDSAQQHEYEELQAPDRCALLDKLNQYEQHPASNEHSLLNESVRGPVEYGRSLEYGHDISDESFQLNGYDQLIGYSQRGELFASTAYFEIGGDLPFYPINGNFVYSFI